MPKHKLGEATDEDKCPQCIKRNVKKVIHGAVNSGIKIGLPGGTEIISVITKSSAKNLKLVKGKEAYAIIKATNVMIAFD